MVQKIDGYLQVEDNLLFLAKGPDAKLIQTAISDEFYNSLRQNNMS